jgi:mycothiol system anti-sigma-R factor
MRCEDVLGELFAYLDRELDAPTAAAIDHHLQDCRGCFTRAEFERKLKAHLRAAADKPAPARLRARVKSILERF